MLYAFIFKFYVYVYLSLSTKQICYEIINFIPKMYITKYMLDNLCIYNVLLIIKIKIIYY